MSAVEPIKRRRGRPPKELGDYRETRDALLRSGIEVLTEKGYSATGIDEILKRVGVPKGSFYHYFGSKDAFGSELIGHYARFFEHKLEKFLLDERLSPMERLSAFIEDAIQGMARYQYKRGCLVGNLGQEMAALPDGYREQIQAVFEGWQDRIEQCLQQARLAGEINTETDCREAAYLFWIGWEGAVMRAKLEGSPDALRTFARFFRIGLR